MQPVASSSRTDIGLKRTLNEDSVFEGKQIWAVADGMGGHAAGDVASAILAEVFAELDQADFLKPQDITAAVRVANDRMLAYVASRPNASGMGSTVSGLAQVMVGGSGHWAVFNVGDSRVYRCHGGVLARATIDHSETEEMILDGKITEAEARHHSLRNVITRSVGSNPAPQVDLWVLPQTPGERFLVCSDGLTNELTDAQIAEVALAEPDPAVATRVLVERALAGGGRDNTSVIIIDLPLGESTEVDEITHPRLRLGQE
ncbi:MAG: serine/threonine-protein phosphatase [Propionibacteriaceae bacterium]|mgnify:CR=1 FL=1|nr:serine/threonine-protein phosphatase [Propionibacteriaceae bacterium]